MEAPVIPQLRAHAHSALRSCAGTGFACGLLLIVFAEANRQRLQTVEPLYKTEGAGRRLARN